jgi:hypothetical protein
MVARASFPLVEQRACSPAQRPPPSIFEVFWLASQHNNGINNYSSYHPMISTTSNNSNNSNNDNTTTTIQSNNKIIIMSVPTITKKVFPVNDASQDIPIFLRSKYFEFDIHARQNHVESYVFRLLGDPFLKACFSDRPSPPMIVAARASGHRPTLYRATACRDIRIPTFSLSRLGNNFWTVSLVDGGMMTGRIQIIVR